MELSLKKTSAAPGTIKFTVTIIMAALKKLQWVDIFNIQALLVGTYTTELDVPFSAFACPCFLSKTRTMPHGS